MSGFDYFNLVLYGKLSEPLADGTIGIGNSSLVDSIFDPQTGISDTSIPTVGEIENFLADALPSDASYLQQNGYPGISIEPTATALYIDAYLVSFLADYLNTVSYPIVFNEADSGDAGPEQGDTVIYVSAEQAINDSNLFSTILTYTQIQTVVDGTIIDGVQEGWVADFVTDEPFGGDFTLQVDDTAQNINQQMDNVVLSARAYGNFSYINFIVFDNAANVNASLPSILAQYNAYFTPGDPTGLVTTNYGTTQTLTLAISADGLGNNPVTMTVATFDALLTAISNGVAATGNPFYGHDNLSFTKILSDTAANFDNLSLADINAIAAPGADFGQEVTAINSDGDLTFDLAQALAWSAVGQYRTVTLPSGAAATITVSDSAANIGETNGAGGLTPAQIDSLRTAGVTEITANDAPITLDAAQLAELEADKIGLSDPAGIVLDDSAASLFGVPPNATPSADFLALTNAAGSIAITNVAIADGPFTLSVAQAQALEAQSVPITSPNGAGTLVDTAANLALLTPSQIDGLAALDVVGLQSTDNAELALSPAVAARLDADQLTVAAQVAGVSVVVSGLAADIKDTLTQQTLSDLFGDGTFNVGFTGLFATDSRVTLDVAQALAVSAAHVAPTDIAGDSSLVLDTAANIDSLTTDDIDSLNFNGDFGIVQSTDLPLQFTVAQVQHLEEGIGTAGPAASGPNPTSVDDSVTDIGVVNGVEGLTAAEIADLPLTGIGAIEATGGVLSLDIAQAESIALGGIKVIDPAGVEIDDAAANIEAVSASQYTTLGTALNPGLSSTIDVNATDANVTIDVMATLAAAAAGIAFGDNAAGDSVSLSGSTSEIENLTTSDVAEVGRAVRQRPSVATVLRVSGGSVLDESIGLAVAVGHANLQIRPATSVIGHVTVRAQGDDASLSSLTPTTYALIAVAGFNTVTTSDNTTYDVNSALAGVDDGLTFDTSNTNALISLSGDASEANALTVSDFQQMGTAIRNPPTGPVAVVTPLQVTGGPVQWSTDQANAAYANAVTAHASRPRSVQVVARHTDIQNYSSGEIDDLSKAGVNDIVSNDGSLTVTLADLTEAAADGVIYSVEGGGDVALAENASAIEQSSPAQLAQLASTGATNVQIGDGSVQLDAAQAEALEDPVTITVPSGDSVTLEDTAADIAALTPTQISGLSGVGFTAISVTDASLDFNVAQAEAFLGAGLSIAVPEGDNLTVLDSQANLDTLTTPQIAALLSDGFQLAVACYARGTRISTVDGEAAIEDLLVGDLLPTASGAVRPIVWIGYREIDTLRHPDRAAVLPVRVLRGAFAEGLPRRDLWLSPGHNVACEGALMPISSLINGRSVAQIERDRVEYWHVELDAHDVILAEGLPAESYLDTGNRTAFINGGAFVEAHPDFAPRRWADTCLPLALEGPAVAKAKARLLARLAERGFAVTQEADAHVAVDSVRIEPIHLSPTRIAFVLPPGGREIELRSNVFVPAHMVPESTDPRELGLCVGRLQIDGCEIALDCDETCATGWRRVEFAEGRFSHRWTGGATPLPKGARLVILDLVGSGHYRARPGFRIVGVVQAPRRRIASE